MGKITIPDNVLKMRTGDMVIYNFEWLLDHLDLEVRHLQETKRWRDMTKNTMPERTLEDIRAELARRIKESEDKE